MAAAAVAAGCGSDGAKLGECDVESSEYPRSINEPWDVGAGDRLQCTFKKHSLATDSVGPEIPAAHNPRGSALKHVIVILRENRSYDHFLGGRGEQPEYSNPDPSAEPRNKPVPRFHEKQYCTNGAAHDWSQVHLAFNNGYLDGFVAASNRSLGRNAGGCEAMGYYDRSDIPFYYWLADNFATSDAYHASLLGPTLPNVMFYYYASSCGATENIESEAYKWLTTNCPDDGDIFSALDGNTKYAVYSDSRPTAVSAATGLTGYNPARIGSIDKFNTDVANNDLADVVFIEPNYHHLNTGEQNDEHPSSNIQAGQEFVFGIINTLMTHPQVWESSIAFITWDEHGGYFDHVVPPKACAPDDNRAYDFDFEHFGFRTPFFAISPFTTAGYVSHITADHTSILRFIETWRGIGALSNRDANAWPLLDMFDFEHPRVGLPPPDPALAVRSTDPVHIGACGNTGTQISSCVP